MKIADTIVHRQQCVCARVGWLTGVETPGFRFDVDGAPFPWYITVEGPRFTRLEVDLYRVDLTIIPTLQKTGSDVDQIFAHHGRFGANRIIIAGKEFPWTITDEGVCYRNALNTSATLTLAFLAKHVDTDGDTRREVCSFMQSVTFCQEERAW